METGGTETVGLRVVVVGTVGTGPTVGRTVEPVIGKPSQSRHSIGQGAGIGLTGDALHCDVYSWGWTQRCSL